MFRVGQRVKVISHEGYKKYEHVGASDAPPINSIFIIKEITYTFPERVELLWLDGHNRGIYSMDCVDASSKLEKALK